jgi:predicted Ser/Thr protein kinase
MQEEIIRAFEDCCGDHQVAVAYCFELKTRTQLISKSLQEFAVTIGQLAHQALVELPLHFIQREAAYAFVSRIKDREMGQHLLMGGERMLDETLNHAVRLEAAHGKGGSTLGTTVTRV